MTDKSLLDAVKEGPPDLEERLSLLEKAVMAVASELRIPLGHHEGWTQFAAKFLETHGKAES